MPDLLFLDSAYFFPINEVERSKIDILLLDSSKKFQFVNWFCEHSFQSVKECNETKKESQRDSSFVSSSVTWFIGN